MDVILDDKRKVQQGKRARSQNAIIGHAPSTLSNGTVQRAQSDPQQLSSQDILSLQRTVGNHGVQRLLSLAQSTKTEQSAPSMRVRSHSAPPVIQRNPEEGEEGEFHLPSEELETTEPQGFKVFEEGEHFLDPKEAETTEAPGFTLLDEQGNPKKSARSHHYEPQARRELQEKEKPKKTISDKLRRYRNMAKHFVKGHTVHSYGKKGLHAIMTRDEKQIRRAARLIKKEPEKARVLLRHVHGVIKQDISEIKGLDKQIALALMAPIWFTRWMVAHAQWKRLAKQVGLIKPKEEPSGKVTEQPKQAEPEKVPWQRGGAQHKDTFGWLHATMLGVGQETHKGKGMSDRDKMRVWQKWRMREMSDPRVMIGKDRLNWMPAYSKDDRQRDSVKGVQLGNHRPVWGFQKPSGTPETNLRMGANRRHWRFNKPSGDRSGHRIGLRAPVWNRTQGRSERGNFGMGLLHRRKWGFDKPSGERSKTKIGLHAPVWNPTKAKGERQTNMGLGWYHRQWRMNKPSGDRSGHKVGLRAPVWNPTEAETTDRSKFKLGKQRPSQTPWGKAQVPNFRQLPLTGSEMGSQRNPYLLTLPEPEMEETGTPSHEVVQNNDVSTSPGESSVSEQSKSGFLPDEIYTLQAPLEIVGTYSNAQQTIPVGTKVMISDIGPKEARVDGDTRQAGYAPILAIKAALGMQ